MLVVEGVDVGHGFSLMADLGASDRRVGHTIGPISDRSAFTIFGFPITIAPGSCSVCSSSRAERCRTRRSPSASSPRWRSFTLVHELGHALAARRFGAESAISLSFLVGWASYRPQPAAAAHRAGRHHRRRAAIQIVLGTVVLVALGAAAVVLRRRARRAAHAGGVVGRPDPRAGQPAAAQPDGRRQHPRHRHRRRAAGPGPPHRASGGRWRSPSSPSWSSCSRPPTGRGPSPWRCSPSGTSAASPPAGPARRAPRTRRAGRSRAAQTAERDAWTTGRPGLFPPPYSPSPWYRAHVLHDAGHDATARGLLVEALERGGGTWVPPVDAPSEQLAPARGAAARPAPVGDLHAGIVLQKALLDTGYLRRSADYGRPAVRGPPAPGGGRARGQRPRPARLRRRRRRLAPAPPSSGRRSLDASMPTRPTASLTARGQRRDGASSSDAPRRAGDLVERGRSMGTRTCSVESRSRMVTALSSSDSKSTVTASGVPISSWRR